MWAYLGRGQGFDRGKAIGPTDETEAPANFDAGFTSSGVSLLSHDITINGVTVSPTVRYEAKDASGTTWNDVDGANTLSEVGAGTALTLDKLTPLLDDTKAILYSEGKYHEAAVSTVADITTEDYYFEILLYITADHTDPSSYKRIFDKQGGGATDPGYGLYYSVSGGNTTFTIYINNGTTFKVKATAATGIGAWYFLTGFFDNSGTAMSLRVNGTNEVSQTHGSGGISLANSEKLVIGSTSGGGNLMDGAVAYFALYNQVAWGTISDAGTVMAERFARLSGVYAGIAENPVPVVTRASIAGVQIHQAGGGFSSGFSSGFETTVGRMNYHIVGDDWAPVMSCDNGPGLFLDGAAENKVTNSIDPGGTDWSSGGFTFSTAPSPDQFQDAVTLIAASGSSQKRLIQTVTITATTWWQSCFAKKGDFEWLIIYDSTSTYGYSFNLNTGAIGTQYGAGTVYPVMEDWGNDWYRCSVAYTGTAAAHTFWWVFSDVDAATSTSGDGVTESAYIFGPQVQQYMSTQYLPTPQGSTFTRAGSSFYYNETGLDLDDLTIEAVVAKYKTHNQTNYVGSVYTDGTKYLSAWLNISPDSGDYNIDADYRGGANPGDALAVNVGGGDISGTFARIKVSATQDSLKNHYNGVEKVEDTTVDTITDTSTRVYAGGHIGSANRGFLQRFRAWNKIK